jgi:hypothetical protein
MDMQEFQRNRQAFPAEELAQYAGKYVAWSSDGKQILASDADELQLAQAIKAAGYDTAQVLIAYIATKDDILLGNGMEILD